MSFSLGRSIGAESLSTPCTHFSPVSCQLASLTKGFGMNPGLGTGATSGSAGAGKFVRCGKNGASCLSIISARRISPVFQDETAVKLATLEWVSWFNHVHHQAANYFLGSSFESPFERAAPAALLISTGNTAPFSNMSCTRTLPSVSEGAAPAARQSSAGGGAPGDCSVLSSNAIATAGASSVVMATLVADLLARLTPADFDLTPPALGAAFLVCFDRGAAARERVVMTYVLGLGLQI